MQLQLSYKSKWYVWVNVENAVLFKNLHVNDVVISMLEILKIK